MGIKPKLNPRDGATKERIKNISISCTNCRLNPHDQLGRPCVNGISESMMSGPTNENSLALAAVHFAGKHMQELGQIRV